MSKLNKQAFIKRFIAGFEKKGFNTQHGFYSVLAEKYNVSKQTPSDWLDLKKGYPRLETLVDIARDLDVSVDYLLTGDALQTKSIPVLTATEAIAGYDEDKIEIWIPAMYGVSDGFAVIVDDDSMAVARNEISYPTGTLVIFDRVKPPVKGDFVFASVENTESGVFAQYIEHAGERYLAPLNPRYENVTKSFEVIGVLAYSIYK